ncbi:ExeA family protein [Aliikangiella sp. G2MR2-5]|uniref:ExeA family protein n=1 Tax=Aliikangiella sp. G2MR2-5 TaxID=2788943 RepID=UPI0018AB1F53|nr:AAA family ATPase [Aliikangiella sp. G2MR2-5]
MYLYQFGMKKLPFCLTPDTDFYCPTTTHAEALNVLRFAINTGEALVKIVGEVGTGKTLICRVLINELGNSQKVAYIPYPKLSARELSFSLANELGLRINSHCRDDQLNQRIQTRLLNLNKKSGPVILIIDEAQLLTNDCLETLRLWTNLETEQRKLIQIVLFGQPELDVKLSSSELRQIKQRITFSYQLNVLNRKQTYTYVKQRLEKSSRFKIEYNRVVNILLHHYSKGVPRLINILCHKSLLLAYAQRKKSITFSNVLRAAKDTESINTWWQNYGLRLVAFFMLFTSGSAMAIWGLI